MYLASDYSHFNRFKIYSLCFHTFHHFMISTLITKISDICWLFWYQIDISIPKKTFLITAEIYVKVLISLSGDSFRPAVYDLIFGRSFLFRNRTWHSTTATSIGYRFTHYVTTTFATSQYQYLYRRFLIPANNFDITLISSSLRNLLNIC